MTTATYETLRVFIAATQDVERERLIVQKLIDEINPTCRDTLGVQLECVSWKDFAPRTPNLPDKRIQDILNAEIRKCQVFLLVLWGRHGSTEPGHHKTNTEREIDIALDMLKRDKRLVFLSYFRGLPSDNDAGPQRTAAEELRRKLEVEGVWHRDYDNVRHFQERVTHDLYATAMRFRLSTSKHEALRKFWVLGTPDRETYPRLAVIYPSMERAFMGPRDDTDVWLNRLEPSVIFEDFKAIQKVEKTLRFIGYRHFRIYNHAAIPAEVGFMNRFWICLPRNARGSEQLARYQSTAGFDIVPRRGPAEPYFTWMSPKASGPRLKIRSPLAKYLREQRAKMGVTGDWHPEMERIVAKDFAILSRIRDTHSNVAMRDGWLNDWFLAGIRGLGTWGAGWFIDRNYQAFASIDERDDFRMLLEVEYRDGRIVDVRNVSDKPQSYFDNENLLATVKRNVERYENRPKAYATSAPARSAGPGSVGGRRLPGNSVRT